MTGRDKRRDLLFDLSPPSLDDMAAHEVPDVKEMNALGPPLFRPDCSNCNFCDGLREMDVVEKDERAPVKDSALSAAELFKSPPFLDRYLAVFILLAMIAGVLIGVNKKEAVQRAFNVASWQGTSIPILLGLLIMMWPVLTKVQYERLPAIFARRDIGRYGLYREPGRHRGVGI
ncbi:unnamed protein product [Rhizoctonia solani]|uniref:Uncharacterized protein n=1 Tax=Rhizoctonia solani TaxID=456999 RepID=A0A8H2WVY3_9AGAM|nr:unnamed protein product [Rhizoctonia solani]